MTPNPIRSIGLTLTRSIVTRGKRVDDAYRYVLELHATISIASHKTVSAVSSRKAQRPNVRTIGRRSLRRNLVTKTKVKRFAD
ncbi:hypothetical protein SAMN05192563_1003231 [Paraburkholderia aspalathi]|uniref:Uncharacterized protein n=1 Tax=Paraburkholderia aspalathi TaxID=1324617 RepID=A0A1I7ABD3_9BURK|nr:hypothetical protein SAMN05192563_1003231 [Paraburkholderia aspalathi]